MDCNLKPGRYLAKHTKSETDSSLRSLRVLRETNSAS